MRRLLSGFVSLFGIVCCLIAFTHICFGPSSIPGSVPVNATMDSEDRFYATIFLGFGVAIIWCARDIVQRQRTFQFLLVIFFLGGIARIVSAIAVGWPNALFQFLGAIELVLPVLLYACLRSLNRRV